MNPPAPGIPVYPPDRHSNGADGKWSSGLCGCCSDVPLCCLTCWCPCIAFGRIAEIVDKGTSSCGMSGALYALLMSLVGCQWIYSCTYRTKIKQQYGIPANTCSDCCVHCWCESCALAQEYRELRHHGLKPSLGWQGNLIRQNRGMNMTTAPMSPDRMRR